MQLDKHMKNKMKRFFTNQQEGIGVIEIILILVIIIGLVLIFRDQINDIVNKIFTAITGDVDAIITK